MLRSFYTFVRVYVRFPSLSFFSFISSTSFQPTPRPFVPPRAIFILLYPNCVYTPRCTYKYNIEKTNGREHRPKEISLIFHNRASYPVHAVEGFLSSFFLLSFTRTRGFDDEEEEKRERKERRTAIESSYFPPPKTVCHFETSFQEFFFPLPPPVEMHLEHVAVSNVPRRFVFSFPSSIFSPSHPFPPSPLPPSNLSINLPPPSMFKKVGGGSRSRKRPQNGNEGRAIRGGGK